jgi:hypothetical protein
MVSWANIKPSVCNTWDFFSLNYEQMIPNNVEKSVSSTNWIEIFKRNNTIIVQFGTHDFFSKCLPIVTMIMVGRAWRLCNSDLYVLAPFNSLEAPWLSLSLPLSRYSIVLKAMHLTWTPNLSNPQAKTLFLGWVTQWCVLTNSIGNM